MHNLKALQLMLRIKKVRYMKIRYVEKAKFPTDGWSLESLRYVGSMLADVHRTLTFAGLASKQGPQRSLKTEYGRDAGNWTDGPSFYLGQLSVDAPADTFLSLAGWSNWVAFPNGFNLGGYWPVKGPQCTLYVSAPLLHAGVNELSSKLELSLEN